ncbi:MAG: hypothetical protein ABI415_08855 [Flavitalea sp.]
MLKKSVISATMLCIVIIAIASSGGGKKRSSIPNPVFTPLRSTGNFSLRSKSDYAGSQMFMRVNTPTSNLYKSVITYQKGNTIYVLPSQYRLIAPSKLSFRSNLNVIDLKIRLNR